jgi:hypothetical protein
MFTYPTVTEPLITLLAPQENTQSNALYGVETMSLRHRIGIYLSVKKEKKRKRKRKRKRRKKEKKILMEPGDEIPNPGTL